MGRLQGDKPVSHHSQPFSEVGEAQNSLHFLQKQRVTIYFQEPECEIVMTVLSVETVAWYTGRAH